MQPEGYAIRIQEGNSLIMTDTCFANNYFLGNGAVILNGTNVKELSNNYADPTNSDLLCSFIYNETSESCIDADSTTSCVPLLNRSTIPPSTPPDTPTPPSAPNGPTPMPLPPVASPTSSAQSESFTRFATLLTFLPGFFVMMIAPLL